MAGASSVLPILQSLRDKKKCVLNYTANTLISVGCEIVIKVCGVWREGVVHKAPLGRRKKGTPSIFEVSVPSLASPNDMISTELGEDNYAMGCVVPSTIADKWAWARLATYVACAYVACNKCLTPYASAAGHRCCKCKTALHNLCSQGHHGARALVRGSELLLCDKCTV
jgi:hypothetical protein